MRAGTFLALFLPLMVACPALAEPSKTSRYGVEIDAKTFPQGTAKETLASLIKSIDGRKITYLVAQLADPTFIDDRVKRIYGGSFAEQVQDTQSRLDPTTVKLLKRFLKDGKWTIDKTNAVVQLDDIKDKCVRLVRKGDRWYLQHNFAPPEK